MARMGTFTGTVANPASDKQMAFLLKLTVDMWDTMAALAAANGDSAETMPAARAADLELVESTVISKKVASERIDAILNGTLPMLRRAVQDATPAVAQTGDGFFLVDGKIIKCQYSGAGRLYGKVLDTDTGRFEYTPGAQRGCTEETRLTLEAAKEFGALYGMCCVCGATLTDDSPGGSIENGIGPVCAKKF